jgi:hypothetical protein
MRLDRERRADMFAESTDGNEVEMFEVENVVSMEDFWFSCSPPWLIRRVMVASSNGAIEAVG